MRQADAADELEGLGEHVGVPGREVALKLSRRGGLDDERAREELADALLLAGALDGMTDTAVLPTTPPSAVPRPRGWLAQVGADSAYTLLRFPIGVAAFVLVVTGLATGVGLLVVWIGVAVLAATLVVARGLAAVERAMIPAVLGHPVPSPVYRTVDGGRLGGRGHGQGVLSGSGDRAPRTSPARRPRPQGSASRPPGRCGPAGAGTLRA